jgi:hypothetical protein
MKIARIRGGETTTVDFTLASSDSFTRARVQTYLDRHLHVTAGGGPARRDRAWHARGVPAPPSDALAAAPPASSRAARRQLVVGVVALVGVYLCVFGPGVVTSIRGIAGIAAPGSSAGWADRVTALEWDVFTTGVVLVVVVRWLPRHAPLVTRRMGLGRGLRHWVPAGLLGASAAYVALAVVSSWAGNHVVSALHLARGTYPQLDKGTGSFVVTSAAAGAAGFTEEITLVALAAAVVEQAFDARDRRSRWAVPATIATLVALRWLVHLYYLWGSVFVLLWAPGVYLLYRWTGSVWPLVLGHWLYDWLALAGQAYPGLSRPLGYTLWLLAAVGVVAIVVSLGRRRTTTVAL